GVLGQTQKKRSKRVEVIPRRTALQLRGALRKSKPTRIRHNAVAADFILHLVRVLQVRLEAGTNVVSAFLPIDADVEVLFRVPVSLRLILVGWTERAEAGDRQVRHAVLHPLPAWRQA